MVNDFHTYTLGNPGKFAIEWGITKAFERQSQLALGCFVIHLNGKTFGILDSEASLLACTYEEVKRRASEQGMHTVEFSSGDASEIVNAFISVRYKGTKKQRRFLGLPASIFDDQLTSKRIQWAPDGDTAFDDSSHVLQFDHAGSVRLIAFKNFASREESILSIVEVWTSSEEFYGLLSDWMKAFERERERLLRHEKLH